MGVFAAAQWFPIPSSPLGTAANGPVQSNDNRYLWWWTSTEIAAFDCGRFKWVGPWGWDGKTVACASQVSGNKCIFSYMSGADIYFRSFNLDNGNYGVIDWLCSSIWANSEYTGYLGSPFTSPNIQFGYDPGIAGRIILFFVDGYGPGVTAFSTARISDGRLSNGIFINNQFGDSASIQLKQGGTSGIAYYGRILAGEGFAPIPDLQKIPFGAIASIVLQTPVSPNENFMTVENTMQSRTYQFDQANLFYPDPFVFDGPTDFENYLYSLCTTGYGGFAGPNALLLTESVTGAGNPATFLYTQVIYTPTGGTFGTPFPVSYSPIGDNALSMCGYQNQVFVGEENSTQWYFLAIAQVSLQIASLVNYSWQGGPAK